MKSIRQDAGVTQTKVHFNFNKLQAAACIVSSAAVSVGLIYAAILWLS